MLTEQQRIHFDTFGFLVLKNCFSLGETAEIIAAFDRVLDEDRQGRPFPGLTRQSVYGFVERDPVLVKLLLEDDRIYNTMEKLLGEKFVWLNSEANLYVGDTHWHPDTRHSYRKIKVALYLDPVKKDTGCLRVIPGSHLNPMHQLLAQAIESEHGAGRDSQTIPQYPLESDPGDVVLFHMKVWHSSFGGQPGRRMMAVNFAENPVQTEHVEEYKSNYRGVLRLIKELQNSPTDRAFEDSFLYSNRHRIQSITSKLVEYQLL